MSQTRKKRKNHRYRDGKVGWSNTEDEKRVTKYGHTNNLDNNNISCFIPPKAQIRHRGQ